MLLASGMSAGTQRKGPCALPALASDLHPVIAKSCHSALHQKLTTPCGSFGRVIPRGCETSLLLALTRIISHSATVVSTSIWRTCARTTSVRKLDGEDNCACWVGRGGDRGTMTRIGATRWLRRSSASCPGSGRRDLLGAAPCSGIRRR